MRKPLLISSKRSVPKRWPIHSFVQSHYENYWKVNMGSVDKEKVWQYEAEIKEAQNVMAEITAGDIEDFIRDSMKIRAIKYTLMVLVEAICNLCRHILTKKAHIVVDEYMEALLK